MQVAAGSKQAKLVKLMFESINGKKLLPSAVECYSVVVPEINNCVSTSFQHVASLEVSVHLLYILCNLVDSSSKLSVHGGNRITPR